MGLKNYPVERSRKSPSRGRLGMIGIHSSRVCLIRGRIKEKIECTQDFIEILSLFTSNVYSIFVILPPRICLLSPFGLCHTFCDFDFGSFLLFSFSIVIVLALYVISTLCYVLSDFYIVVL